VTAQEPGEEVGKELQGSHGEERGELVRVSGTKKMWSAVPSRESSPSVAMAMTGDFLALASRMLEKVFS
jgi:hypothetical protein